MSGNKFDHQPRSANSPSADGAGGDAANLSTLFHYPAIGSLFEAGAETTLQDLRARLRRTGEQLDRVIRQGSRDEAARAASARRALDLTEELLDSLKTLQQQIANRSNAG